MTIITMYATVYVYVHVKFKGFNNLMNGSYGPHSEDASRHLSKVEDTEDEKLTPGNDHVGLPATKRPVPSRTRSQHSILASPQKLASKAPWDDMEFITANPLHERGESGSHGIATTDFAHDSISSAATQIPEGESHPRRDSVTFNTSMGHQHKPSEIPSIATDFTGETVTTDSGSASAEGTDIIVNTNDPLKLTRIAIRRQLRFLFIYPAVYLAMWPFPFASHCLTYSDYYATHPPFWLSILSTCCLALQAGVEAVVFSWRERPWTMVDEKSPLSMSSVRHSVRQSILCQPADEVAQPEHDDGQDQPPSKRDASWWEEEGRKRKDSVWMGTDTLNLILSRSRETGERS